jgi:transcriptional regulator with XRE-family HTH domain
VPTETELLEALARALPEWRRINGLSQDALAESADVSPVTVMSIENEHHMPRPSTLRRIAQALGIEVKDLYKAPTSPLAEAR